VPADQTPDEDADLAVRVGAAVRDQRDRAGLSMRALAACAGISQPFLSTIERGLSSPSMSTLYRIATGLGVAPGDLLPGPAAPAADRTDVTVVRADEAPPLPASDEPGAAVGLARLARPGLALEVVEYRVAPGEHLGGWFDAPGEMAVLVLAGLLDVEVAGVGTWRLAAGDLLHQPGHLPHRWSNASGAPVHLVLVGSRRRV
jgi:transcriptional regulator with XRE-family HTH domain